MNEASPWLLAGLAFLLFCSGVFSSSETALFSLTPAQRRRAGRAVEQLVAQPRQLLMSVLICNLVVNVLYFAFATRLLPEDDPTQGFLLEVLVLVALLIFGEVLPKTIGLRGRVRVASLTAPPLRVAVVLLRPLTGPLRTFLDHTHRWVSAWVPEERGINAEALAQVMKRAGDEGALLGDEADLLAEVIELDDIRVREIMTPRVDALFLDRAGGEQADVVRAAIERRQSWLPVVDGNPDRVVGRVRVRDLLREPERPVDQLVMPIKFVPEVASALDLLHTLREDRTAEAVVVDEWGGTAGYVTAEDVFEELVGDLRTEDERRAQAVVPLGSDRYRVEGGLAIRDWNQVFGQNIVPVEFETLGGFVTALLGRIPAAGDTVHVQGLELVVHEVRGRRVTSVDIGVRSEPEVAEAGATSSSEARRRGNAKGDLVR